MPFKPPSLASSIVRVTSSSRNGHTATSGTQGYDASQGKQTKPVSFGNDCTALSGNASIEFDKQELAMMPGEKLDAVIWFRGQKRLQLASQTSPGETCARSLFLPFRINVGNWAEPQAFDSESASIATGGGGQQ
ncbi:hypothetical protein FBULB1_39 [Fusarium bulbicola]|nr:hypothetical protein FBULB1_39 [Fusarium bulbicola]